MNTETKTSSFFNSLSQPPGENTWNRGNRGNKPQKVPNIPSTRSLQEKEKRSLEDKTTHK